MTSSEDDSVVDVLTKRLQRLDAQIAPLQRDRNMTALALEAAQNAGAAVNKPKNTIQKEMGKEPTFKGKIKATLTEKFPEGATAQDILAYVNSRWTRQILRSSLSPQLSRLKNDDGLIDYDEINRKWFLKKETPDNAGALKNEFI